MAELEADIGAHYPLVVYVGIHLSVGSVAHDGGSRDIVVEIVVVSRGGHIVAQSIADASAVFVGQGEIVVCLALQVGIAIDHEYVAHKEIHIHFLERGSTKSLGVGETQRVVSVKLIHRGQFPCRL